MKKITDAIGAVGIAIREEASEQIDAVKTQAADSLSAFVNTNQTQGNIMIPNTNGTVDLTKGSVVDLSKNRTVALDKVAIGLGWTNAPGNKYDLDLDLSAFVLGADGKVRDEKGMIFYGNLQSPNGSIVHTGDDETGEDDVNANGITDEEDEVINVTLSKLHADVKAIVFVASIDGAAEKENQTFAAASSAFMNLKDVTNNKEVAHYTLENNFKEFNGCKFCSLGRNADNTWAFKAIGDGTMGNLAGLCAEFGLGVK